MIHKLPIPAPCLPCKPFRTLDAHRSLWKGRTITIIEAVRTVLDESLDPMHYTDIAESIMNQGLALSQSEQPARTVASVISTELKKKKKAQKKPLITRVAPGIYTLSNKPLTLDDESDTIIKCFGMFWKRSKIEWTPNPKIFGMQYAETTAVDFAYQKGVYLLYESAGREVLYVGRVLDRPLGVRLFEHTKDRLQTRWERFSWFGMLPVGRSDPTTALPSGVSTSLLIPTLEALLIEALEPRQNRKRGDDLAAVEYTQI